MAHIDQAEDDVIEGSPEVAEEQLVEEEETNSHASKSEGENPMDMDELPADEDAEYEIERILRAKRGVFKPGQYAYLVKWKGYTTVHNSWVSEKDAENARELIDDYWERTNKASKQAKAHGRKSSTVEGEAVKRGRGRRPAERLDTPHSEVVIADEDERPKKKPRRSNHSESARADSPSEDTKPVLNGNGGSKQQSLSALNQEADDGDDIMNGNWENRVKDITTVEMLGKELMVYFETHDGQHVREPSRVCARRFPMKLIQFYESHLKWRAAGKKKAAAAGDD